MSSTHVTAGQAGDRRIEIDQLTYDVTLKS
jgi:hypothetical protein